MEEIEELEMTIEHLKKYREGALNKDDIDKRIAAVENDTRQLKLRNAMVKDSIIEED